MDARGGIGGSLAGLDPIALALADHDAWRSSSGSVSIRDWRRVSFTEFVRCGEDSPGNLHPESFMGAMHLAALWVDY